MNFKFAQFTFQVCEDKIYIKSLGNYFTDCKYGFAEATVSGRNYDCDCASVMCNSSEGTKFRYVSHKEIYNRLIVIQQSEILQAQTVFESYDNCNTARVCTTYTNITGKPVTLEHASSLVFGGIIARGEDINDISFTGFTQCHHGECQPAKFNLGDYGMFPQVHESIAKRRVSFANTGAWSTKERLPIGIIANPKHGKCLMFQIENNNSWYYEISDRGDELYLYTGGANMTYGGWSKILAPGDSYITPHTAIVAGKDINEAVGEMTKYRRNICGLSDCDKHLPVIFNEYMHLSWDSPSEQNTLLYAPVVAKTGAEYYVIDCGWHDEEPGDIIYSYVGKWIEGKSKFPSGIKKTMDYIKSLGMKPGLWIEPEIVGVLCKEMLEFYGDECFYQRNGERVTVFNRCFLDYRNQKVIEYMSETIRRMVEDYGAEYIKFDFNQDPGVGTDLNADSCGDGLELCAAAFLKWVDSMKAAFPHVVFEGCASGGMRMDYKTLSTFSLVSTSDQIKYDKYPYIAGNVLSAVIPEQAAVWSYPVGECTKDEISDRQIIVNMINSFLGRMHLASHLEYLNDSQLSLVSDGVKYYNTLTEAKKTAVPYFPFGFTKFGDKKVSAGFISDNTIYLAVWNTDNCANTVTIPVEHSISSAKLGYPYTPNCTYTYCKNELSVSFDEGISAAFFEIAIN